MRRILKRLERDNEKKRRLKKRKKKDSNVFRRLNNKNRKSKNVNLKINQEKGIMRRKKILQNQIGVETGFQVFFPWFG